MTSRLVSAMNAIAEVWEALTPPEPVAVKYRRMKNPAHVAHRGFFFTLASGRSDIDSGTSFRLVRYELDAIVRLDLTGLDLTTATEERANTGALLEGAVQFHGAWPAGVRSVTVVGSNFQVTDRGEVDLLIALVIQCEESDGT